jgi:ribonuclease E
VEEAAPVAEQAPRAVEHAAHAEEEQHEPKPLV